MDTKHNGHGAWSILDIGITDIMHNEHSAKWTWTIMGMGYNGNGRDRLGAK